MIQHRIPINSHTKLLRFLCQRDQLIFRTPFRPHAPFLVEFTEIPEIVDVVAVSLRAGAGFAGWRDPDVGDADAFELRKGVEKAAPVGAVGWDVPFECLEEGGVLEGGFLV